MLISFKVCSPTYFKFLMQLYSVFKFLSLHKGPFCRSSYSGWVQRGFIATRDKTLSFCQCGFASSCKKAEAVIVRVICIFYYLQKGSFQPSKDIILVFYTQKGNWFDVNNDKLMLRIISTLFTWRTGSLYKLEPKYKLQVLDKLKNQVPIWTYPWCV